jgi:GAG-pre-integrase domain
VEKMEAWDKACNQSEGFDFGDEVALKDNMQEISMNDQELEEGAAELSVKAEFLKLHHRLGHLAFSKMKKMAKMGTIAAKFANCDIPACTSCMYGKAIREPWRGKSSNPKKSVKVDESMLMPGEIICVDQMESKVPGLIAQMKGWLTKKRNKFCYGVC